MKKLLRVALVLTTGALVVAGTPVRAQTTVVVDDDGFATPTNCGANVATHATIQGGVDAASAGDTVRVCPGTYTENVDVAKTLNIRGARAGVDARSRTPVNESVVHAANTTLPTFMLRADGIVLNGFLVEGNTGNAGIQTSPGFSGYQLLNNIVRDNVFGIYLHSSGVTTTVVRRSLLHDNNAPGAASGNGIYSDQGAVGITIAANRFEDHANAGVIFANAGVVQQQIVIRNNRSLNDNTFVALFDVQQAQVVANRFNDTDDSDDFGSTIFVGGDTDGILVQNNVLRNPGFAGIAVRDTLGVVGAMNVRLLGNTVTGAEGSGIDVTAAGTAAVTVRNNTLNNNGVGSPGDHRDGIRFGPDTDGNQIRVNTATGNAEFDCHDESTGTGTAGTANIWANNDGGTDQPTGICP
jgi:parallel beta helix pectate lyase-like protein